MDGLWAVLARNLILVCVTSAWLATFTCGERSILGKGAEPPCLMAPNHLKLPLSHDGLVWLEGEEQSGPCEAVPDGKWIRKPSGKSDLFIHAAGPSGSGRYWTLTVGVGRKNSSKPARGICLATSTVGWRTLQQFKMSPLVWLDDVDGDGKAEVILWDSFPIHKDASMAEFGMTAWVYRLTSEGSLVLDWNSSRKLARELAAAYRLPLSSPTQQLAPLRGEAAAALMMFAEARCAVAGQESR
ncbi:MAG: hypothetical protein HY508_00640 [Acidobacteria bacterium]|nr:hypothetical protein [Acidobacteriota bacterium]